MVQKIEAHADRQHRNESDRHGATDAHMRKHKAPPGDAESEDDGVSEKQPTHTTWLMGEGTSKALLIVDVLRQQKWQRRSKPKPHNRVHAEPHWGEMP